jgi:hypothetical protein
MPSAGTGRGDRKHSIRTQTGERCRDLGIRYPREWRGRTLYLRIVRPLFHREPQPDSEIILQQNFSACSD